MSASETRKKRRKVGRKRVSWAEGSIEEAERTMAPFSWSGSVGLDKEQTGGQSFSMGERVKDDDDVVVVVAQEDTPESPIEIFIDDDDDDEDYLGKEKTSSPSNDDSTTPLWPWVQEIVREEYRTVYFEVASAGSSVEDDEIWSAFSIFGAVEKLRFAESGGAVVFETVESVDLCIQGGITSIEGVALRLRRLPTELNVEEYQVNKIHVSGIFHLSDETLTQYFSSFGTVEKVELCQASAKSDRC